MPQPAQQAVDALGAGPKPPSGLRDQLFQSLIDTNKRGADAMGRKAETDRNTGTEVQALAAVPVEKPVTHELPAPPPKIDFSYMNTAGPVWAALAAIGGIGSRRPMVTAMQAMAGAMQGYMDGNIEQYKLKREEYKDAMESALRYNEQQLKKYHDLLTDKKLSIDTRLSMGKFMAAADGDTAKQEAFNAHSIEGAFKELDNQQRLIEQARHHATEEEFHHDTLNETNRHHLATENKPAATGAHKVTQYQDKENNLYRDSPAGGLEMQDKSGQWKVHEGPLPPGLTKLGAGSGRATVAANTAMGRYETLSLANDEIDKLEAEGTLNLSVLANAYPEGKGLHDAYLRWLQQEALPAPVQRLLAATQLAAESIGHSVAGARMSDDMFSRMMTQFVPMPGNTKDVIAMKREHRFAQERAMLAGAGVNKDAAIKSSKERAPSNPYLQKNYDTPEKIKAAVQAGALSRDEAIKLLQSQHGFDH